jgi:aspartyl-tRNA(Asn)/glutamyl-tRNA(Gln) amidotransferase subunit C
MIDKSQVRKVSEIARLELSEQEVKKFTKEFNAILDAFKKLDKIKTKNVEPSFQPIEIKDRVREDRLEECLSQEEALANTKNKEDGFFKGPRIV